MENILQKEWDLTKFRYSGPTDQKIKVDYHLFETKLKNFCSKWKGKKDLVLDKFDEFLNDIDLLCKQENLWIYLGLISAIKINDTELQVVSDELQMMSLPLSEELLFVDEIYKEIGAQKLTELAEQYPDYRKSLISTAETIKHLLTEDQEKVIIRLSDAFSDDTYDQYKGALSFTLNDKELTFEELWNLRSSAKRQDRIDAFTLLSEEFNQEKNSILFGNIYTVVCKSNVANITMRKMSSV